MLSGQFDRFVARPCPADQSETPVLGQERCDQLGQLIIVFRNDHAQRGDLHALSVTHRVPTMRR